MSDAGGFILLACTGLTMFYVADLVLPINTPAIRMRWAIQVLSIGILSVAVIYGAFALSVETGSAVRPWAKASAGVSMLVSARLFVKALAR